MSDFEQQSDNDNSYQNSSSQSNDMPDYQNNDYSNPPDNNTYYQSNVSYSQPKEQTEGSNGFSIAALVLGSLSAVFCCIPYLPMFSSLLAIIFAGIGIKKHTGIGMAVAGLILGLIIFICHTVIMLFFGSVSVLSILEGM